MSEVEELKERIAQLESELHTQAVRANAAIAAAQDRVYLLDRWHIDLDAVMASRAGRRTFDVLRWAYSLPSGTRSVGRAANIAASRWYRATKAKREPAPGADAWSGQVADLRREWQPGPIAAAPVTDRLYAALSNEDLAELEPRLKPGDAALWATAEGVERRRLALAFACHYGLDAAVKRASLTTAAPPATVHAPRRGPLVAGGSFDDADLVAEALLSSGVDLDQAGHVLELGSSSGSVTRALVAAFPKIRWHACDPDEAAIAWASGHLRGAEFAVAPERPPLNLPDGAFDGAFGLRFWSRVTPEHAIEWLEELRRLLKPGGLLVVTTAGNAAIAYAALNQTRPRTQLREIRDELFKRGYWFAIESRAAEGGNGQPAYSATSFLSAEWLLEELTPGWELVLFRPGAARLSEDLHVLRRR